MSSDRLLAGTSKLPRFMVLAVAAAVLCSGCTSGSAPGVAGNQQALPEILAAPQSPVDSVPGLEFPAPDELASLLPEPRATSYVEADLIKDGANFDPLLPHNRADAQSPSVEFDPAWHNPEDGIDLLGYCMYAFSIPGYDRNNQIRYTWGTPPGDYANAWIGLGNWDSVQWDWFACSPGGKLDLASLDPYISFGDAVLLCVVVMGLDDPVLEMVRIGTYLPEPSFTKNVRYSFVPVTVSFDASASSDPDGEITRYEWDFDNDGVFEADQQTASNAAHIFTDAGMYNVRLRVTDNDGMTAVVSDMMPAAGPHRHTWGKALADIASACAVDGDGNLYVAGRTENDVDVCGALLAKFDAMGQPLWAKTWDGDFAEMYSGLAVDDENYVYTCGSTDSVDLGNTNAVLQKWDADGNLIWSKTWGGNSPDYFQGLTISSGDLFVTGETMSFSNGNFDVALARFTAAGELVWDKHFGSTERDDSAAITAVHLLIGSPTLRITGSVQQQGEMFRDLLYLSVNEDGSLVSAKGYGDGNPQTGYAIAGPSILGGVTVIVGDHIDGSGDIHTLLLSSSGSWAKTFHWSQNTKGYGILRRGDNFLVGGHAYSDDETTSDAFLLTIGSDGSGLGLQTRDFGGTPDDLYALAPFAGGMLMAGNSYGAGSGWEMQLYSVPDAPGSWYDIAWPLEDCTATIADAELTVADVTDAVLDTGGGDSDFFFELRE